MVGLLAELVEQTGGTVRLLEPIRIAEHSREHSRDQFVAGRTRTVSGDIEKGGRNSRNSAVYCLARFKGAENRRESFRKILIYSVRKQVLELEKQTVRVFSSRIRVLPHWCL